MQGTAGNDGGNGKTVVDHILKTLRENDEAKKELYKILKTETGFNVEPYLEGLLKERQKWEKEIAGAARKSVTQNKELPWYVRLAARLKLV